MKYISYNILYENGKKVSRPYRVAVGTSKSKVKTITNKYNRDWNKMKMNKGMTAKLYTI